jgi:hypothetical protein
MCQCANVLQRFPTAKLQNAELQNFFWIAQLHDCTSA